MILDKIICDKRLAVEELKKKITMDEIYKMVMDNKTNKSEDYMGNRKFKEALSSKGFNIIGEVKKASPSKGIIVEDFNVEKISQCYDELPIKAISVLTEEKYFMGSAEYVRQVKSVTSKPILRKDFIVDKYQIYETALMRCNGILLIAAVLGEKLHEFYNLSLELGIEPLVEVHSEEETYNAMKCESHIIGINNRNLQTFEVDIQTTERLMRLINNDIIIISESGIKNKNDIGYLKSLNVNGALIGEAFMRSMKGENKLEGFF